MDKEEKYSPTKANDVAVQVAISSAASQAKMSSDIQYLIKGFDLLNTKMDNLPNAYVSMRDHGVLEGYVKSVDGKVDTLQKYVWMGIGGIFILDLALKYFLR